MANVVSDPKQKPQAVIPDFTKPDPLLTFTLNDVAFVYGSKWKQRYFTKVGNDYFPLPAQWDVQNRVWRAYMVQPSTDWWVPHYPADNMKRPTGPLCDGCHSVNYDVKAKTVTEWNVGCEKCHGPGSLHVQQPSAATIVNPARLDYVRGNDVCIQCHSQGQPLTNPIEGQYYDWPVGFKVGLELKDFWTLEEHKLGETTFTHFADGTAHKNRMQGNDFVSSVMYTRGVTCFSCHDVHGTSHNADLVKPAADVCATCHRSNSPAGPHTSTIEEHTHHPAGSAGSECVACHMPKIAPEIANVNVRTHTFRFITPTMTEQYKMPNACIGCHTERTNQWASEQLRQWSAHSPWRLE
jgi:predicted CXXCH cytochrome family protein